MANTSPTGASALSFNFAPMFSVRAVLRDGEPWFVAKDVAEALDYSWAGIRNVQHIPDEWRGVESVSTPSGEQEMHILSEQGLYFFLGRSDKPKALPFQKWLAGEVLPAIRKTGRYIDPNAPGATAPPPASVAEYLNGSDLQNLKRLIGFCTQNFLYESSWNQGIWFYLRQVTGVPSPHQFNVEHLPVLASELLRINAISYQVQDIIRDIEAQAVKRIFRKGEAPDLVLADLKRQAEQAQLDLKDDIAKLPSYFQSEYYSLIQRTQHPASVNYGTNEKPGYFDPAKAT